MRIILSIEASQRTISDGRSGRVTNIERAVGHVLNALHVGVAISKENRTISNRCALIEVDKAGLLSLIRSAPRTHNGNWAAADSAFVAETSRQQSYYRPSPQSSMPETTVLKVLLHCDGCVSKVKRHIRRLEGVESLHVDQKNSKVTVYGTVKPQAVLDKVLRAGKTAEFWPQPEAAPKAEPAAEEVVGGKKKAVDGGGNGSAKKQKSGKTESIETVEFDDGDGEILNETNPPSVDSADESDTQGLMDKMPATPVKKGRKRRG